MSNFPKIGLIIIATLLLLAAACLLRYGNYKPDGVQRAEIGNNRILAIANNKQDRQSMEDMWKSEMGKRVNALADQLQKARDYEKKGNYTQAEIEFKKALDVDKEDQGMAHRGLARVYEASGEYALALEQIDWLLQRTSRRDVLDELLARKQNLEKLLADRLAQNNS